MRSTAEARIRRLAPSRAPESVRQWRLHVDAGERVAELLAQLSGRLAGLPGGDRLQHLVRGLEDEIAACDAAAWRAIRALEDEQPAAH